MACFVCGNIELSSLCDRCGLVSACSNHIYLHCNDQTCFPFKIGLHKNKGRYVFPKENPIQCYHKLRHSLTKNVENLLCLDNYFIESLWPQEM